MEKNLKKIYLDKNSPAFLAGSVDKLFRAYRLKKLKPVVSREKVKNFLAKQQEYTIHRRAVEKIKRNRVHVKFIGDVFAADLIDFKSFSRDNDGFKYILCGIDCFSKKAFAEGLKDKTPKGCLKAFQKMKKNIDFKIHSICVDNGNEFKSVFKKYCKNQKINLYRVQGTMKNSIVERFIYTFKSHLFRYIRLKGKTRWVDVVKPIIKAYNSSYHRSIKMAPINVTNFNSGEVYKTLFPARRTRKPHKLQIDDVVRFSKTFQKGIEKSYEGRWSLAVYRISDMKYTSRGTEPMYQLKEVESGDPFGDFWWYESQLQKVDTKFADEKTEYDLEVLEQSGNKSKVRWLGYHNLKPTWIPTKQIVQKKKI